MNQPRAIRGWLAVPPILAVLTFGASFLGRPPGPVWDHSGPPGLAVTSVIVIAGMLATGAGTAGLLLMHVLARCLDSQRRPSSHEPAPRASTCVFWESLGLGLSALCTGLFLLALVGLAASPEPQSVVFQVLSWLLVVDGRALILGLLFVAASALACCASPLLQSTLRDLRQTSPVSIAGTRRVRTNRTILWSAAAPLVVSAALLVGTGSGVRVILRVMADASSREAGQRRAGLETVVTVRSGAILRVLGLASRSAWLPSAPAPAEDWNKPGKPAAPQVTWPAGGLGDVPLTPVPPVVRPSAS